MINKAYTKTGASCRVTFLLPAGTAVESACVSGDWNDWDPSRHPLKRAKDGSFSTTISLKPGREYRFRYYLDGERWENEAAADAFVPNPFGSEDSVIRI